MPYQVNASDGRCLYRGGDIELACEIYNCAHGATLCTLPTPSAPQALGTRFRTGMPTVSLPSPT